MVKTFLAVLHPDTLDIDDFESKINDWMDQNPDVEIYDMAVGITSFRGEVTAILVIAYGGDDDVAEVEITLTSPRKLRA